MKGMWKNKQTKVVLNGRILSKFLLSAFVKNVLIFWGTPNPLKKNLNSRLRKWQMVGWGILGN